MAEAVLRFVSAPDVSRTTLLDLNDPDGSPPVKTLRDGTDLGAPPLERVSVSPMGSDGDVPVESRYGNRTLTLVLRVYGNAAAFAAFAAALARQLDRAANWLEWRPPGVSTPVFFRTFRTDISRLNLDNAGAGNDKWDIEVPIAAEPFAVGLEETGSFTAGTNPAGTSKPFGVLPAVKGDVPAPLTVKVSAAQTDTSGPIMVSVCSGAPLFAAPYFVQGEALTLGTGASLPGADSAMSGSSYARIGFGTNNLTTLRLSGSIASVPPGRWKVWARLRNTAASDTFDLRLDLGTATSSTTGKVKTFRPAGAANSAYWFDLGEVAHPYYQPPDVTAAESMALRLYAQRTAGSGSLDVDVLMLVPADLRGNHPGRTALTTPTDTLASGDRWVLRPDLEMAHPSAPARPAAIIGSHEFRAVPGEYTYVHVLRRTYPGTTQLTTDNTLDWSYRPRYVYVSAP